MSKSREVREAHGSKDGSQIYNIKEHGYNFGSNHNDEEVDPETQENEGFWHRNDESDEEDPRRPYKQIKHIFEIKVKELRNMPVLNKFICQSQSNMTTEDQAKHAKKSQVNKYIQNIAVKYSFPLDEDEILESDYLQLNRENLEKQGVYNYSVSMDTVHTYILSKEDDIKKVLELCQSRGGAQHPASTGDRYEDLKENRREELFNMSIALF